EIRKRDVEHQATRCGRSRMRKKIFCRRKYLRLPACELDQQLERLAHGDVVVYDKDDRLRLRLDCWRHIRSAVLSAFRRSFGSNGLNKHSTAPCAIKRGRTVASRWAVIKTIGIDCSRSFSSRCKSGPLIPGIATSSSKQLVFATASDFKNSSADENICASKPNSLRRSGSDSRTDSSSSTTDMRGRAIIAQNASLSARCPSYFGIDRYS